MPYNNINEMPTYTHKYTDVVRRQAMHVFNTIFENVYKDTKNKKVAEKRAMMAMNSVLKKRLLKQKERNTQDYMNQMVDVWLGNLNS